MNNNKLNQNERIETEFADNILKTTALLYLREALFADKFEQCKELVEFARAFGAKVEEVVDIINEYITQKKAEVKKEVYHLRGVCLQF